MDLILSAAVVVLFILAAAAAWPAMYALWSRATADTDHLNFWQLARRRGLTLADLAGNEREVAHATYRCIACQEAAACDAALAARREGEVAAFCPNRQFIDDLAARRSAHASRSAAAGHYCDAVRPPST